MPEPAEAGDTAAAARFIRDAAAVVRPGHITGARDPGDAWVDGAAGKFWGKFGSAGLLVFDAGRGILLQHRAIWSHHGGTWGLPGGALHEGEAAVDGALREAWEEAGVPRLNVELLFTSVFDVGYWSYTTVAVLARTPFEAIVSDPESLALEWVKPDGVARLPLHPGFASAWPGLRRRLPGA
ncbi:8-oxo-dGTP pyrophosphatase MutT (NUDIX family) [Arthrobacter silviterrae]|uniref:NUDIX hydrolase n=1 Tax=Arthrobacter silviterrae TaxID=2026658 RepID=A0ABX0DAK1_9MICC|nr:MULTISPECIES: NUDIX hydrolase [Arthrobacter]MCU6478830.1 NUDIX hydrolase [Arthrobacter sp. A2-55]MDQ0276354.1 8-oxo-dGTP pyrophosphatase MutT (NUDIX family) [Arthrobacter silviterrae]NGN82465.1 NUDIX hydrolase [Arthrobacter silviterrae]